ncbi:hypothetical protein SRHO_G00125340 [Serrasalmus rhombeus]
MALIWILILFLYITDPVQAVGLSEASFVSAESGETVTLHCKFVERSGQSVKSWVWYRQRAGQEPQEVAVKLPEKRAATSLNRLKIIQNFNLTIEQTEKTDEGMYFCGVGVGNTITFSKGTFLAVTESPVVLCLGAALGVCVVVISAQAFIIIKRSDRCSGRKQQGPSAENTTSQTAESLNYAPIHFKENKAKPGRVKREQPEDIVYSQVRSSNAKAHRSHR